MWFRKLGVITIITIYLLVLAGGIVRSTGSGMGCPDWPRCFGQWIPPTSINELPADYQTIYGAKLKGEVIFNSTKTWIEYINRLLGALTGVFIFGMLVASIPYLKKDKLVFYLTFTSFLLIGFQGWLGSKVVSSELLPFMVTLHMMLAVVIIFLLLYILSRSFVGVIKIENIANKNQLNTLLIVAIAVTALQVVFGTQVREAIDEMSKRVGEGFRETWVASLGLEFIIHRSFSWVVLICNFLLIYKFRQNNIRNGILNRLVLGLGFCVIAEIATGVSLAYLGFPAFIQPLHLTIGILILGIQFVIGLFVNEERVFLKAIKSA